MIKEYIETTLTTKQAELAMLNHEVAQGLLKSLDRALISGQPMVGLPYWAEKNPLVIKELTFVLVSLKMATVRVNRKYSNISFNLALLDSDKVTEYRTTKKLQQFLMREDTKQYPADMVRVNGSTTTTGLVREGFAKAAKHSFKYDTVMLNKYYPLLLQNLVKGLKVAKAKGKLTDRYFADEANYEEIAEYCLNYYTNVDATYNLEYNTSDSRGRSIMNALKRVGNPISSKDFRSLLIVPGINVVGKDNHTQMNDIYYFIAELIGNDMDSYEGKLIEGKRCYNERILPDMTGDNDHILKDLHEYIWLERIYNNLDKVFASKFGMYSWNIPLEVDASMSIAQIMGAITGDARLLERTNVIGSKLSDPWFISGVRRDSAKAVGTPTFYGSSQSPQALIKSKKISIDKEEIKAIKKEFSEGGLAIMKQLKNAIINGYSIQEPVIQVTIFKETFNVHVNKFKQTGSEVVVTEAFDGKRFKKSFTHQPTSIPDYRQFKLFWVTGLVHNLDSQCLNSIAKDHNFWMLPIHDAAIVLPGNASKVREAYAIKLREIYDNRNQILWDFRKSIGATNIKDSIAFMKLEQSTVQMDPSTIFSATAMK